MPIYAYKCGTCGHAKDVLQKSPTPCSPHAPPAVQRLSKQVTAAGFQLKGSGWYVTDFRGGSGVAPPQPPKPSLNLLRLPPHRLRPRASSPQQHAIVFFYLTGCNVRIAQMAVHGFAGHRARRHHRLGVELDCQHAGPDR